MYKTFLATFCAAAFFAVASSLQASLIVGDAKYLGHIHDGSPASAAHEAGYINDLVTLGAGDSTTSVNSRDYDRLNSLLTPPFPTAISTGAVKDVASGTFQYVLGKYANHSYVWFDPNGIDLSVMTPSSTAQNPGKKNPQARSHFTGFNPVVPGASVPEPASVAVWSLMIVFGSTVFYRRLRSS